MVGLGQAHGLMGLFDAALIGAALVGILAAAALFVRWPGLARAVIKAAVAELVRSSPETQKAAQERARQAREPGPPHGHRGQ